MIQRTIVDRPLARLGTRLSTIQRTIVDRPLARLGPRLSTIQRTIVDRPLARLRRSQAIHDTENNS